MDGLASQNTSYDNNGAAISHSFWTALAEKADLSAEHIRDIKNAEREYYAGWTSTEVVNGQTVTQTTGGVLDARRDFEVNGSRAKADLHIGTVTAAGVYYREVASAGSQLAQARSTYETDWAALNLESSGWSLGNPYLWLTSGYGGSNGSSTTSGTTTGGTITNPNDSGTSGTNRLSGYLSESWAPPNPQSSDVGSSTPTTGGNPTPPVTNGTTTGTGTPTMPVVPTGWNGVAGDDSPQYEPPHSYPISFPSRFALLTGQYPDNGGVYAIPPNK